MEFEQLAMPLRDDIDDIDDLDEDVVAALTVYDGGGFFRIPDEYSHDERLVDILDHLDSQECHVVRDEAGEIIGIAEVDSSFTDEEFRVHGIAVHSDFRGSGIGKVFMEYLERLAKERRKRYVGLRAMNDALSFYERLDYKSADTPNAINPLMRKYL